MFGATGYLEDYARFNQRVTGADSFWTFYPFQPYNAWRALGNAVLGSVEAPFLISEEAQRRVQEQLHVETDPVKQYAWQAAGNMRFSAHLFLDMGLGPIDDIAQRGAGLGRVLRVIEDPAGLPKVPRSGGRRGNETTREHIDRVRDEFLEANPDYQHVGGGRDRVTGADLPEEYLPPLDGGRRGASYPDLTFQGTNGERIRINTADTKLDGTLTPREQANFDRIFEQTGEPIIGVPKPR
jgi:hypothetical protein